MSRDDYQLTKLEEQSAQVGPNISWEKTKVMGITQRPSSQPIAVAQGNITVERFTYLGSVISIEVEMLKQISTLDWQKQQCQSFDDLTTSGDPARLASRLNWISTPPLLSLQPYMPARPGRVQLEYASSWTWTHSISAIYGGFWALCGMAM